MLSRIGPQITAAIFSLILLLTVGTVVYKYLEDWTWIQSFYFTAATLSTVGYGDLHPTSDASRLFTAFFILGGVAIALSAFGMLGISFLRRRESKMVQRRQKIDSFP